MKFLSLLLLVCSFSTFSTEIVCKSFIDNKNVSVIIEAETVSVEGFGKFLITDMSQEDGLSVLSTRYAPTSRMDYQEELIIDFSYFVMGLTGSVHTGTYKLSTKDGVFSGDISCRLLTP